MTMFLRAFLILFIFRVAFPAELLVSLPSFDQATSRIRSGVTCGRGQNAICVAGNASSINDAILITNCSGGSLQAISGWAYYSEPLHLWNNSSSSGPALASFTTSFSIETRRCGTPYICCGAAFFLSPYPFQFAQSLSNSFYLGLNTSSSLAAIEFDTYPNSGWDGKVPHIGIDINSMASEEAAVLHANSGEINGTATIRYEARTQNLTVTFIDSINQTQPISLSYPLNLTKILPEWVVVGVSGASGYEGYESAKLTSWKFDSTIDVPSQDGQPNATTLFNPTPKARNTSHADHVENRKHSSVGVIAGIIIGVGLMIALVASLLFYMRRRGGLLMSFPLLILKKDKGCGPPEANPDNKSSAGMLNQDGYSIDKEIERDNGPRMFKYSELSVATADFSENNKLGAGGFGSVYRGFLRDLNMNVAIKRFSQDSRQGPREYVSEVKIISQLRHKNLVHLHGWCHERNDLLLVYDFMPNRSLDYHLFGTDLPTLPWAIRYKIALGLASALSYLHTGWEQCVLHRDVKSSNVMLDGNFNAKLGDFGLARLVDHESRAPTTLVIGTPGYIAPECFFNGKYSQESDIYSFGVLLLEILSGKSANDSRIKGGNNKLVDWVWSMYKEERLLQVADPRLEGEFHMDQMERLIMAALSCANLDLNARPTMQQAIAALNFDIVLMPSVSRELSSATLLMESRTPQVPSPTTTSSSSTIQTPVWSTSYTSVVSSNNVSVKSIKRSQG